MGAETSQYLKPEVGEELKKIYSKSTQLDECIKKGNELNIIFNREINRMGSIIDIQRQKILYLEIVGNEENKKKLQCSEAFDNCKKAFELNDKQCKEELDKRTEIYKTELMKQKDEYMKYSKECKDSLDTTFKKLEEHKKEISIYANKYDELSKDLNSAVKRLQQCNDELIVAKRKEEYKVDNSSLAYFKTVDKSILLNRLRVLSLDLTLKDKRRISLLIHPDKCGDDKQINTELYNTINNIELKNLIMAVRFRKNTDKDICKEAFTSLS